MANSIFNVGDVEGQIGSLSEQIATLNSNKTSLKIWVGEITFSFSNSSYASCSISDATGGIVNSSNVLGFCGVGLGYGFRYAIASNRQTIVAYDTSSITATATVLGVFFYS